MWYAAHAVMLVRSHSGEQTEFPVCENIFLVEAATPDEAHAKAESRAREDETHDENITEKFAGLTWDDEPAEFKFLGLRKLMQCFSDEEQPGDGIEVSHNKLLFENREQLDFFVQGEEARLTIEDERFDELEGDTRT